MRREKENVKEEKNEDRKEKRKEKEREEKREKLFINCVSCPIGASEFSHLHLLEHYSKQASVVVTPSFCFTYVIIK